MPRTCMRYSERTTQMSAINWKRQREEHCMQPLPSHSRGQNKAGRHGWQALDKMLERTNGQRKSSNRSNSSIHMCGRDRAIFPWRSSLLNIAMPLSRCRHVPNTFSTSCQTGAVELDFCLMQFNAVMPASRQQWLASGPMTDPMECAMTLSSQRHTFYHMTR